jgi:stress response protein YsnF
MAKTLVGLYDTFADAESVVQDLVNHSFSRSDISLVTHDGSGRQADYTYSTEDLLAESGDCVEWLTDIGVPENEARSYTGGLSRRGALVVVYASDEMADSGMEIMQRSLSVHINERTAQGQMESRTHVTPYTVAQGAANARRERERLSARRVDTVAQATADARREQEHLGARRVDKEGTTIPVVEEEVSIGKRQVEHGKTRIHTHVEERPVEESVRLREEKVVVERHPVNRPATEADLRATEEETIEVTETVEEPVVSKRARVVEEVTVRKEAHERTETVRDKVRRKDVDVESVDASHAIDAQGFAPYAADFRRHHTTLFASSGLAYTEYEPAYRYGYDLGTNERYRGREWAALEADARRDWEVRQPGTWERFKDAIRYGWDKVRART